MIRMMDKTDVIMFLTEKCEDLKRLRGDLYDRRSAVGENIDDLQKRYSNLENGIFDLNKRISKIEAAISLLNEEEVREDDGADCGVDPAYL